MKNIFRVLVSRERDRQGRQQQHLQRRRAIARFDLQSGGLLGRGERLKRTMVGLHFPQGRQSAEIADVTSLSFVRTPRKYRMVCFQYVSKVQLELRVGIQSCDGDTKATVRCRQETSII